MYTFVLVHEKVHLHVLYRLLLLVGEIARWIQHLEGFF